MHEIRISACVIVKNEERNIQQWLENVRRIADEIIVVDTGSQDRTVELARQGGAALYEFAWIHDFSAAKNYALDQAHGDWIVFLDADEYFTEDALRRLPQVLREVHPQRKVAGLISPWINIDLDNHGRVISQAYQMRVFRRSRTLRYVGNVHEMLRNMAMDSGKREYRMTDLAILHTGYSSHIIEAKSRRNLELLLKEQKEEGQENPEKFPYFMDVYCNLGEYEKGLDYARRFLQYVEDGHPSIEMERKTWMTLFSAMDQIKTPAEQAMGDVDHAIALHPNWPELAWEKGRLHFRQMCYEKSREFLLQAIALDAMPREEPEDLQHSFMPAVFPKLYHLLGEISRLEGKEKEALSYWKRSLEIFFYQDGCLTSVLRTLLWKDATVAITFLEEFSLDEGKREFLCRHLRRFPLGDVYLYFGRPRADSYEGDMIAARYDRAAMRGARALSETYERAAEQCMQWPASAETLDWLRIIPQAWKRKFPQIQTIPHGKEAAL